MMQLTIGTIGLICIGLFMLAIYTQHKSGYTHHKSGSKYGSILPDAIIPRTDLMMDTKDQCAPPPCADDSGWDLRDTGLQMSGCSKVYIPNKEATEDKVSKDYFETEREQIFQYRVNAGRETPFRDIYDSFDRIQKSVYQSPRDTLHEKTTNPKFKTYLTPAY